MPQYKMKVQRKYMVKVMTSRQERLALPIWFFFLLISVYKPGLVDYFRFSRIPQHEDVRWSYSMSDIDLTTIASGLFDSWKRLPVGEWAILMSVIMRLYESHCMGTHGTHKGVIAIAWYPMRPRYVSCDQYPVDPPSSTPNYPPSSVKINFTWWACMPLPRTTASPR